LDRHTIQIALLNRSDNWSTATTNSNQQIIGQQLTNQKADVCFTVAPASLPSDWLAKDYV
jgi:hypothetical protein